MTSHPLIDSREFETLAGKLGFRVQSVSRMSGGDINDTYLIGTGASQLVIKINHADTHPGMFEAEKKGLDLLAKHSSLIIPRAIYSGKIREFSFLLLSYVQRGNAARDSSEKFGRKLAEMHKTTNPYYGLDHSNYIGSLEQSNDASQNWIGFFTNERILPLFKKAYGYFDRSDDENLVRLLEHLEDYFISEPPALLHGDLWSGNYFFNTEGDAVLYDPAVYYGHRLMDIAMTRLFGGFTSDFYRGYDEVYSLPDNWQEACEIANLYPLLVHVNLFGTGYVSQVRSILNRYS